MAGSVDTVVIAPPAKAARPRKESLADVLRRRSAEGGTSDRSAVQFSLGALTRNAEGTLREVPLDELHANPFQPRFQFHRQPLEELARSLASEGQLEPVIARPVQREGRESLEIVAGERRLEAARICNSSIRPFPTLRVDVRQLTDDEAERISLIENLQRENLTPLEEGYRYWQLQKRDPRTWSVRAIAEFVHKKKSTVQNRLGLVKDPAVAEAVLREQIPPTAGFHILRLPQAERRAYLRAAIAASLTVEQIKADVDRRSVLRATAGAVTGGAEGRVTTLVRSHLRGVRASAEERDERRRTLESRRADLQVQIEALERQLHEHLAELRGVERELETLAE